MKEDKIKQGKYIHYEAQSWILSTLSDKVLAISVRLSLWFVYNRKDQAIGIPARK